MKTLPYLNQVNKNISSIDSFAGLNKGFRIAENELSEDINMCSDDYPALSVRRKRKYLKAVSSDKDFLLSANGGLSDAAIANGNIAVITGDGCLYYENYCQELNALNNKMLRMGNMLYIYPEGLLCKLPANIDEQIIIEKSKIMLKFGVKTDTDTDVIEDSVLFLPARLSSLEKTTYSEDEPIKPNVGDYWYNNVNGLQMYGDTGSGDYGWIGVEPDGILVKTNNNTVNFDEYFKTNDAIFISGTKNDELDMSFIAYGIYNEQLVLNGYLKRSFTATACSIEKKMPANLDFVVEHNNRLWGCFCGYADDGNYYNEIYASALNDPTNWYRYDGTASQSYTISCVSEGKFTGAAVINGYVTFFREDCMHRIYGDSASDFQLVTYECAGIQQGSEKSIACYNGTYFYKSNAGIMSIADSYPVGISDVIGHDIYSEAIGGTDGSFYYVCMKKPDGDRKMFVYDLQRGIWHCEDSPGNIKMFLSYGNNLYAVCEQTDIENEKRLQELQESYDNASNGTIKALYALLIMMYKCATPFDMTLISFSKAKEETIPFTSIASIESLYLKDEKDVKWSFETCNFGYSYYFIKYIKKLLIRMYTECYSRVDIEILYDSNGEWLTIDSITGSGTGKMHNIQIRPQKCDHFKLRFSGYGDVKILGITQLFEEESGI